MHTIIRDGQRVHLGISTGGHYLSEDGGETFNASNTGVGATASMQISVPNSAGVVYKIARHSGMTPGRLDMQNHGGWAEWGQTRRTAARHRRAVAATTAVIRGARYAKGLPSDFGFPIVVHPHDPDTVYVVPLQSLGHGTAQAELRPFGGARTAAIHGAVSRADCRKRRGTSFHRAARRDGHRQY